MSLDGAEDAPVSLSELQCHSIMHKAVKILEKALQELKAGGEMCAESVKRCRISQI